MNNPILKLLLIVILVFLPILIGVFVISVKNKIH